MSRSFPAGVWLVACCGVLSVPPTFATPPAGFTDQVVPGAGSLGAPVALAFTPDRRLLVTTQDGTVWVIENGVATPALSIPASAICSDSERGLLGLAVDPLFVGDPYLYLFYTRELAGPTCVNRLSRFTMTGNAIDFTSERVLVDNMPSTAGNHNAGDVQIGRDGHLYVSIGDGGCDYAPAPDFSGCRAANDATRDMHALTGKILRLARDGSIPADNPYQGAGTARCNVTGQTTAGTICQEIFATGLRNPFRLAVDPNAASTRIFLNDVGQNAWEEIDILQPAGDYGWNVCEGAHDAGSTGPCDPAPPGAIEPIFEYQHGLAFGGSTDTDCGSVTGAAFVPNGLWPGYDGAYLFTDSNCGEIFRLTESSGSWSASLFAGNEPGLKISLRFGPFENTQALYYTTYTSGGQVRRVVYDNPGGNDPPVADLVADPVSGPLPLLVNLDASGSTDPDLGDAATLTYFWDFGEGGPEVQTISPTTSHSYASADPRRLRLRVRDSSFAFSAPIETVIFAGNGPWDFHTIAPCRLFDSREPAGPWGGPILAPNQVRRVVAAGRCGLPATVRALAVNVTVVSAGGDGTIAAFPPATSPPAGIPSTVAFRPGLTRAGQAMVALDGGALALRLSSSSPAHAIIDVSGYFIEP